MQLKLLNFYKMIANIANNLVGAFVPLIIYDATQSLVYAGLFLVGTTTVRFFSDLLLNKYIQRQPEIFLLSRFLTLGIYCLCLSFIQTNLLLFAILVAIFLGFDNTFKNLSNETLFNYSSSVKVDSKSIAITRIFEQIGVFAGILVGGVLLDVSQVVVYILATILYFIAIIPLFIFYLKNKKKATFNSEYVSNATMFLSKSEKRSSPMKYLATMMLFCYGLVYSFYAITDLTTNIFNLNLASGSTVSYTYASMFVLAYHIAYFIGNMIVGKLEKKFDLLKIVQVVCFVMSAMFVCFAFITNIVLTFVCFAVLGLVYAFLCAFMLQRFLQKSRILGISNKAFVVRECSCVGAYAVFYGIATLFAAFEISLNWFFMVSAFMLVATGIILPMMEESTRKMLVDFVEDNEISVDSHQQAEE